MSSNVLPFVKPKSTAFEMPQREGMISNVMIYTEVLQRKSPERWQAVTAGVFSESELQEDWEQLDFAKVERFVRDWFENQNLQLIQVRKVNHKTIKRLNWEIYYFDPQGRIKRQPPGATTTD